MIQKCLRSLAERRPTILVTSIILLTLNLSSPSWAADPFYQSEFIFPLEKWHNHGSCLLELPNGDLLVSWFHGSGEHMSDDLLIQGARKRKNGQGWSQRFLVADTANFPDANPVMFLDGYKQLWLVWSMIAANDWRTSFLKFRISDDYQRQEEPLAWKVGDTLMFAPKDFATDVQRGLDEFVRINPGTVYGDRINSVKRLAGDKFLSRMGWIARSHALTLPTGRIVLPLYSDGLSLSMMAISDDGGKNWITSKPIVGIGNIQPSLVRKNDGTLVAYMRNAGPGPRRLFVSVSADRGLTWSVPRLTNLPNPNSASEVIRLSNGEWALVYNDTEEGRNSLAVSISDDEGKSWRWTRHLERANPGAEASQFHYPSIIQTKDGMVHVSYSYFLENLPEGAARKTIKYATFNLDWVKATDNVHLSSKR
jgi:predicted neuraminidase